jgi:hypothetical protein
VNRGEGRKSGVEAPKSSKCGQEWHMSLSTVPRRLKELSKKFWGSWFLRAVVFEGKGGDDGERKEFQKKNFLQGSNNSFKKAQPDRNQLRIKSLSFR